MTREDEQRFAEFVAHLCAQPAAHVVPPTLASVCAYLCGYDHARDGGPLAGFREWLVVRFDGGDNLGWPGLLLAETLEPHEHDAALATEREAELIIQLGGLLDEFLRFRRAHGLTKIHHDYARWLQRQAWYRGPLRGGSDAGG